MTTIRPKKLDFESSPSVNHSDSFSSSSSSDNEEDDDVFGRTGSRILDEDRIRAQLLESFYGSPKAAAAHDQKIMEGKGGGDGPKGVPNLSNDRVALRRSDDMDDVNYDAHAHVLSLLKTKSTEQLLVTNEAWTQEGRSLDSTMQTLVYENYQKFIHATDAVKSIGSSVNHSQEALMQLSKSTEVVHAKALRIEEKLQKSRDAIAEKILVKNQLENLQSVLNLPQTLKDCIEKKHYLNACHNAKKAMKTLSNASFQSFQSLRRIQTECQQIMLELSKELEKKLSTWSSREIESSASYVTTYETKEVDCEPPATIGEIFDCAGALKHIKDHESLFIRRPTTDCAQESISFIYSKQALQATQTLLQSHFDKTQDIYDTSYFDYILEATCSYKATFSEAISNDEVKSLYDFSEESIDAYLSRFREQTTLQDSGRNEAEFTNILNDFLTRAKEFSSDLEDMLLDVEGEILSKEISTLCDEFLNRIYGVVETSVKKMIQHSFVQIGNKSNIRLNEFLTEIRKEELDSGKMQHLARMTIVALAENVENVISELSSSLKAMPMSQESLETAVINEARYFALWLSVSLEIAAGSEDVTKSQGVLRVDALEDNASSSSSPSSQDPDEEFCFNTNGDDDQWSFPKSIDFSLICPSQPFSTGTSRHEMKTMLIIADTCRLAEQIIIAAINESVCFMFVDEPTSNNSNVAVNTNLMNISINADGYVTKAFRSAASRILLQYSNIWANAAIKTCLDDLREISSKSPMSVWYSSVEDIELKPRLEVYEMLSFVKDASSIFCSVFGEPSKKGGIPSSRDVTLKVYHHKRSNFIPNENKKKNDQLLLDVERMLAKKTPIFCEVDASLDAANACIFRIFLKAFCEFARNCWYFSESGCLQLEIDALFMRAMIPHYVVNSQLVSDLEQLLDEVLITASERCIERRDTNKGDHNQITGAICQLLDEGLTIENLLIK